MIRPPASARVLMTAPAARLVASSASSNTEAVPNPTTGTRSPLPGMARVMGASEPCAKASRGNSEDATSPAEDRAKSRRVKFRVMSLSSISRCQNGCLRGGAAFLGPAERGRQHRPAQGHRQRAQRDRAELQAQELEAVEHPAV